MKGNIPLYGDKSRQRSESENSNGNDYRSEFRRDYARLIHSPAFRRLQGKTQLFPGHESDFFRNRLTHSLEVAQIAKGIALKLNADNPYLNEHPIDYDLVEFAGLAHDIGHPPFGHNGEHALDDCMKSMGGFEGNAQTLRILTTVEKKRASNGKLEGVSRSGDDQRLGLNLTFRSLASILKYDSEIPWMRRAQEKIVKGYYSVERDIVSQIKEHLSPDLMGGRNFKTIECQIMDLADDIAYSTYDLEDGLKGGFVDPLMLISAVTDADITLLDRIHQKVKKEIGTVSIEDIAEIVAETFGLDSTGKMRDSDASFMATYNAMKDFEVNGYARSALTSSLVNKFITNVDIHIDYDFPLFSQVSIPDEIRLQIEVLKHLNYEVTIMSPRLKLVEYRGYEIVRSIFEALNADEGYLLLPKDVRTMYVRLQTPLTRTRLICDFVAGMTDRYAVEFFGRLKQGDQSIFKPF